MASSLVSGAVFAVEHRVANEKLNGTPSIDFASGVLASDQYDDAPTEPTNFLIVGSDSREDLGEGSEEAFGDVGGQRSDTIMVAHVDPRTKSGVIVSFPRDLVVDIPGMGREKINSAFNSDRGGGPERLILTLKQNFKIDISHYLEVDFAGFARIVDTIGNVHLYFPGPATDAYTGLFILGTSCAELDGSAALAYVRSRHYRYFDYADGEWHSDGTSDFGRIRRQQYFIRSLMQQALDRTARQPHKAFTLIDRLSDMITIDKGINIEDIKKLAFAFINSNPSAVEMYTVPVQSGDGGLLLRDAEAQPLFAKLSLRPLEIGVIDYSQYRVDVLNANAEVGAAQTALGELAALGFGRGRVGDTDSVARTELRYSSDAGRAGAEFVKLFLGGVGEPVHVDDLGSTADVVLVLGSDFEAVRDAGTVPTTPGPTTPGPNTPGPSTTLPATTATTIAPQPGEPDPNSNVPRGNQFVGCG